MLPITYERLIELHKQMKEAERIGDAEALKSIMRETHGAKVVETQDTETIRKLERLLWSKE